MTRIVQALRTLALGGFALLALAASSATAAPTFPKLTGRVVDEAHILPAATVSDLTAKLQALETKTSRQLVVATIPSLQGYEISDYGYQLGRAWGIGQKGLNNGVLLIVAPSEHKVRIEVGYGMEGVITDAFSSVVLQTQVLPKFKAGDMPGGVVAGADALIEQMSLDPSTAEQRLAAAKAKAAASAGSGDDEVNPIAVLFVLVFIFFILRAVFGRRGGGGWWWLPILFSGGGGGGGRWSDGGGGGGSFGGGGSSGSW